MGVTVLNMFPVIGAVDLRWLSCENPSMRKILRRVLLCVCAATFFMSVIYALPQGTSCKTSDPPICDGGGSHYLDAVAWLAAGVVPLVGAVVLRERSTSGTRR